MFFKNKLPSRCRCSSAEYSFADGLQLQISASPDQISELLHSMQSCISKVKAWATANKLKLNNNKTEHMLVTSKRAEYLHNVPTSITIGNAQIPFKQSVKNLSFPLDCHLTMNTHVSIIARTCIQVIDLLVLNKGEQENLKFHFIGFLNATNDPRLTPYVFQQISVATIRVNMLAITSSFRRHTQIWQIKNV